MNSTVIISGCCGVVAAAWIGLMGVFGLLTMRLIPRKRKSWPLKFFETLVAALFLVGAFVATRLVNDFTESRASPVFGYLVYVGYAAGAVIGFRLSQETEWAFRYKDRACGDRVVPSDVKQH